MTALGAGASGGFTFVNIVVPMNSLVSKLDYFEVNVSSSPDKHSKYAVFYQHGEYQGAVNTSNTEMLILIFQM